MVPDELIGFLRSTELFRDANTAGVSDVARALKVIELRTGQILVRQGELVHDLFFVLSGRLRVTVHNRRNEPHLVSYVEPGESVGEMAVLCDDPASATIEAAGQVRVAALSRISFNEFSAAHPHAALQVTESLSRRQRRQRLSVALHLSELFEAITPEALAALESELEMVSLYGGEVLFRQGDPGDFVCMVISGRVRIVSRRDDSGETTFSEAGPGELVGEIEVVSGHPRVATVEAIRDSQLAKLTKDAFDQFALTHGKAAVEIVSRKVSERLRELSKDRTEWRRNTATIAIVPAHPSVPKGEFADGLLAALTQFGPSIRLTSDAVDTHLGQPGIAQTYERGGGNIRIVEWMSKQEFEHSYVLYEADPFLSPWTERCIRQANHVIIVADAEQDPSLGEIEAELLQPDAGSIGALRWLVMIHHDGGPKDTKRWLEPRNVVRHFHLQRGDQAVIERLARVITGRAVGLTLGGGFARGLAHVGVFRAFEDFGVAVDAVGGASMGALVGALWAMGWDRERIIQETRNACSGVFGDLTFPFIAFKSGRKFSKAVRELLGDIQIEDLWMPYFCISANLNRSELKMHTHGPLAKAVLAATRAPGVFPPIVYDGELHVDGGIINNVPVDLMKTYLNDGIVVGVDVSPPHELNAVHDYGDEVSGWRAFWKRCNPFSNGRIYTPSILLVMIRTLEYTGISYKSMRVKLADMYMYPELLRFKRTDFHLVADIAQAGYNSAREHLLKWLASEAVATRRPDLGKAMRRRGVGPREDIRAEAKIER
jgi:lysophospholipid hydrolase